jgi:acyl-CoA synthetase (AMP-forming)/AMP-acid ligase II
MRPHMPAFVLYLATFLACLLAAAPACTGNQRQKTLRATVISVNAARDGFVEYDRQHQLALVEKAATREEGEKSLAAYRLKRTPVVAGFEATYIALTIALTQTDDPSLRAALEASSAMIAAIKSITGGP